MKICVFGTWHLGSVTAACLAARGFPTIGLDGDQDVIAGLKKGTPPLFEPGLNELVERGIASSLLDFSTDPSVVSGCSVVWVTFDTPVDDDDVADVDWVKTKIQVLFPHLEDGTVVLISSQLPVGTTRALASDFANNAPHKTCHFAYSPENLRLGKAINVFSTAERIIVGGDHPAVRERLQPLLAEFTDIVFWTSIESAEMVKHAINAFLATSITFANEIATICELVGADAADVEHALRLEPRIGPTAYIRPGASFAGGTLARDVVFLRSTAAREHQNVPLLESILPSNEAHRYWPVRRLIDRFGTLKDRNIVVLGLTYKPGTDTLRRSSSIETCRELAKLGATVRAFDPAIRILPKEFNDIIELKTDMVSALAGADAAIVSTEWPEFKLVEADVFLDAMREPVVCDPNRFLSVALENNPAITYMTVGRP